MRAGTAPLIACGLCLALAAGSPATAQISVASLDGGWIRIDSNFDPNDRMRIRVEGGRAQLTYVPENGSAGFQIGQVLWQGIGADGSVQVRGSNGQYYGAALRVQGDELTLEVGRTARGDRQVWRRAGPSIDGDWVRLDPRGAGDDGMRIRVNGDRAAIRYLPSTSSRRFRVGTRLWQDIGSGGTVAVMDEAGRYQPARITLIGDDRLRVDADFIEIAQTWVRPGSVESIRAAIGDPIEDPTLPGRDLVPLDDPPTIDTPDVPPPGTGSPPACVATSIDGGEKGLNWGWGLTHPAATDSLIESLGMLPYRIDDFAGPMSRTNLLTDLERSRLPGGQEGFSFVWHQSPTGRRTQTREHRDMTAAEYDAQNESYRQDGYRPSDIEAYETAGGTRYAGVWVSNPEGIGTWVARALTADAYGTAFQERSAAGFRIVDVEVHRTSQGLRYTAIWYRSCDNGNWRQVRGMDREEYQRRADSLNAMGFRVVDFESYRTSNGQRYAAVWERVPGSTAWAVRSDRTLNGFLNFHRSYTDEGLRLEDFEAYETADGTRYAGVWVENDARYRFAFKPILDDSIQDYRTTHGIPGLSVVVMRDDEVVYRRGFGMADTATNKEVYAGTVYSIASISKAIGATLAAKLEARGLVDLTKPTSDYLEDLPSHHTHTLEQLLSKTGCMFHYPQGPEPTEQYYRWRADAVAQMQDSLLLSNCTPGTRYHYSTHGFTFVGAALEEVTGKDIVQLLDEEIIRPLGLSSMRPLQGKATDDNSSAPPWDYRLTQPYLLDSLTMVRTQTRYEDASWKMLGGGLQSDALDLARFGRALMNGWIVSDEVREDRLFTSFTANVPRNWANTNAPPAVGLAWELPTADGRDVAEHGGSSGFGARSHLAIYRNDALVIAILTNQLRSTSNGAVHPLPSLAYRVARIVLNNPP